MNVGIRSEIEVESMKTNLTTGIWEEEVGGKVMTKISHGYVLNSIIKGRVFNYRFSSSLVAEAEFPVSQALPKSLALTLVILGSLMLFIGLLLDLMIFLIGMGMVILGFYFFNQRKLITPPDIDATLKQSNTMVIVLQNILPEIRTDRKNEEKEEEIRSRYKYLFLEIEFSETITAEESSAQLEIYNQKLIFIFPIYSRNM